MVRVALLNVSQYQLDLEINQDQQVLELHNKASLDQQDLEHPNQDLELLNKVNQDQLRLNKGNSLDRELLNKLNNQDQEHHNRHNNQGR